MGSSIIIGNGNIVSGRSIVINNGVVMVDGNRIDIPENEKIINIQAENVGNIHVDICEKIIIKGNVGGDVDVFQGSVSVGGDVKGDVDVSQGNVDCGNVEGDVSVSMGNISSRRG
jgi:hypothetical protein